MAEYMHQDLIDAITANNLAYVRCWIQEGGNVNVTGAFGDTPLLIAVDSTVQKTEMVELLIQHGANVNAINDSHNTALMRAALCNHLAIAALLIQHGAHMNFADGEGTTALILAISNGHLEMASFLIEHGANVYAVYEGGYNSNTITIAVSRGDVDMIRLLAHHGANVNWIDRDGDSCLTFACHTLEEDQGVKVAAVLIALGANVNHTSLNGRMPLHAAAQWDSYSLCEMLIACGANPISSAHSTDEYSPKIKTLLSEPVSLQRLNHWKSYLESMRSIQ